MLEELYKILEKPTMSSYGDIGQKIILLNILINIFVGFIPYIFTLKPETIEIFTFIENVTVTFFISELFARYIVIGQDKQYKGLLGRIKFSFTPYILIDIIALMPYFLSGIDTNTLIVKLLRFSRLLKLFRVKRVFFKFFDIGSFATSSIVMQMSILFVVGVIFIFIFKFAYSNPNTSLMIFLDPPALAGVKNIKELLFGILELILGLFVAGAFISIITEALVNITHSVKKGYQPYTGKNHIVIVNSNPKLTFILEEINNFVHRKNQIQDIVLFLPFEKDIEKFYENLSEYLNLDITIISGDIMNWNSYEKININKAQSFLFLTESNTSIKYQDIKIIRFLLSHQKFKNKSLQFVIETDNLAHNKSVYQYLFNEFDHNYKLVNHVQILESFLNRSIINANFYKVFSSVLSFEKSQIFIEILENFEKNEQYFSEIYMKISHGIVIGIIKSDQVILNPQQDILISLKDKLIILFQEADIYNKMNNIENLKMEVIVQKPHLKDNKKIGIIGNYVEMKLENITQFLTEDSIKKLKQIPLEKEDFYNHDFWIEIIKEDYDALIFNMNDDDEFVLMLYLFNKYATYTNFLQSIVNIMHSPINAMLLSGKEELSNVILSKKITGQYITQVLFTQYVVEIFDELTHAKGNEFYLLEREFYREIFSLDYKSLKTVLLQNNMLYIGIFKDNDFIPNAFNIEKASKIVVLARGE